MKKEILKTKIIKDKLEKKCVICGEKIKVIIFADNSYSGGHYFGKISDTFSEYWECIKCYK